MRAASAARPARGGCGAGECSGVEVRDEQRGGDHVLVVLVLEFLEAVALARLCALALTRQAERELDAIAAAEAADESGRTRTRQRHCDDAPTGTDADADAVLSERRAGRLRFQQLSACVE